MGGIFLRITRRIWGTYERRPEPIIKLLGGNRRSRFARNIRSYGYWWSARIVRTPPFVQRFRLACPVDEADYENEPAFILRETADGRRSDVRAIDEIIKSRGGNKKFVYTRRTVVNFLSEQFSTNDAFRRRVDVYNFDRLSRTLCGLGVGGT